MDAVVAIPALDPDERLIGLVDRLQSLGFNRFIVVDDGSGPQARPVFQRLEQQGACVVHHPQNLGKGSALKTALAQLRFAYPDAKRMVTVDADGQHLPTDVLRACRESEDNPGALVLGARAFDAKDVPLRSRLGNAFSALYFKMDTGVECVDTQTGLRVIPWQLFTLARQTAGSRYEYEMNFLTAVAKRGHAIRNVPISTVYEDGNSGSHFRPIGDSLLIYRQFVRFAASSVACSVLDLAVFALIVAFLGLQTGALVAVATVTARMLSGALNFGLNRTWSFAESDSRSGPARAQAVRYGLLFVAQMLASMGLVTAFSFLPAPLVAVKALVDGSLFFVSHFIQKNWVFTKADVQVPVALLKGESHAEHASAR